MKTAPAPKPRLALLGAPMDLGASLRGACMGPTALRIAGLAEELRERGFDVEDRGDVAPRRPAPRVSGRGERARNLAEIAAWARALSDAAYETMREGAMPVFLGGDHSLSMGSVNGVARHASETGRPLFVLWLDAHADFNTPDSTPSGNMHGMSAALLTGEPGLEEVFGDEPRQVIDPANLHLFGIRSIDRGERNLLVARGIDVVDMRLIDEHGASVLMRRVLERVAAHDGLLHVSFDLDVLDPAIAPGVGTDVPGGLTYREAHLIMELLFESGLVTSLDVVELNPYLDERGRSARLAVDLVSSLFGRQVFARPGEPAAAPALPTRSAP
ncbi:MAG TPA: arginase [Salinarimonas sp.]|nr:arginase [Salinarimonas sp.]